MGVVGFLRERRIRRRQKVSTGKIKERHFQRIEIATVLSKLKRFNADAAGFILLKVVQLQAYNNNLFKCCESRLYTTCEFTKSSSFN